jgi:hypothetical protein
VIQDTTVTTGTRKREEMGLSALPAQAAVTARALLNQSPPLVRRKRKKRRPEFYGWLN